MNDLCQLPVVIGGDLKVFVAHQMGPTADDTTETRANEVDAGHPRRVPLGSGFWYLGLGVASALHFFPDIQPLTFDFQLLSPDRYFFSAKSS